MLFPLGSILVELRIPEVAVADFALAQVTFVQAIKFAEVTVLKISL